MIRFLLLLICVFGVSFSKTLDNLILNEEFNFGNSIWSKNSNKFHNLSFTDTTMMIEFLEPNNWQCFWKSVFISPDKDFVIETKLRFNGGDKSKGYGISFNSGNYRNSNYFLISENGTYSVYYQKYNKKVIFENNVKSSSIKFNSYNTLKIEKLADVYNFYINDTRVYTSSEVTYFGTLTGICLLGKMTAEVDYFKIYQEKTEINLIEADYPKIEKVYLNDSINTVNVEKSPKLSPDGKTLFFSREFKKGSVSRSDIYYSKKDSLGEWGVALEMDSPLNNTGNNSLISMTSDETTCLLMNTYKADGSPKGSGISISKKSNNKWSVPNDVNIIDFHNNSNFNEYHLSADGNILVLTLERNETFGLKDIYVSFKVDDSTFTKPKNLGGVVNTFSDETGAFLAPDLSTLYYSTAGFMGFGSNDIYMTKRLDSSWTNWTEPVNLGPEINSSEWDAYLTVDASGLFAYMTSSRKETGLDILKFELPKEFRPDPVCLVKGRIIDSKTNEPINAKVEYKDLKTNEMIGRSNSDDVTGAFQIILLRGKKYAFNAQEAGYYPISQNIDLSEIDSYKEIEVDLYLTPIEKGAEIVLNNLFFEFNKTNLIDDSFAELDNLIRFLSENSHTNIDIVGYTDDKGTDAYNINLSKERAEEVKKYLISKGIDANRLSTIGRGKNNPIVENDTEENRAKNRRVEFIIK